MYFSVESEGIIKALVDEETFDVYLRLTDYEKDELDVYFPRKAFLNFDGEYYLNLDAHEYCEDGCHNCSDSKKMFREIKSDILKSIEN